MRLWEIVSVSDFQVEKAEVLASVYRIRERTPFSVLSPGLLMTISGL